MKALHPSVAIFIMPLVSVVFLALAGCKAAGIESKRVDYKAGAVRAPSLEVPPDLTALIAGDRYVIPDSGGEIVTSFSEYSKGDPRQNLLQQTVLPEVPNVYLERSGTDRWLVVNDKAENVWPKVRAFWQESGFTILSENPAAGLIETDWAENRAKIPQGGVRAVIGKVFDKLYSSGEKDSYRTRLERKKDGESTEIYIRHRGMAEVVAAEDKSTLAWQPRPSDPEMEAAMLQLLMVRLGGSASAQSAVADTSTVPLGEVTPKLETFANGSKLLLLNEPFDKCWRRVGLALEKSGLSVADKDRAQGQYFINMNSKPSVQKKTWGERLKFWRQEPVTKPELYQVRIFESNSACRVNAINKDESKDQTTNQILELLYKQINN